MPRQAARPHERRDPEKRGAKACCEANTHPARQKRKPERKHPGGVPPGCRISTHSSLLPKASAAGASYSFSRWIANGAALGVVAVSVIFTNFACTGANVMSVRDRRALPLSDRIAPGRPVGRHAHFVAARDIRAEAAASRPRRCPCASERRARRQPTRPAPSSRTRFPSTTTARGNSTWNHIPGAWGTPDVQALIVSALAAVAGFALAVSFHGGLDDDQTRQGRLEFRHGPALLPAGRGGAHARDVGLGHESDHGCRTSCVT